MKCYRQGDVIVVAISGNDVPEGFTPVPRIRGRIVLAEGEVTGHAHAIADRDAELFKHDELEDRFLQVLAEGGVALAHEEHATVLLPPGNYVVRRQREYTPEAIRRVAD